MDDNKRAVQYMLLGCALLTMMDACAKLIGTSLPTATLLLSRFGLQMALLLPLVLPRIGLPTSREHGFLALRGLCLVLATTFFFTAINHMPIADALAIFFIMPLIVTILSPFFLNETFGWRRTIAIIVGLFGVLLIVRPSREAFGLYALMPIGTALFFSLYIMITRRLSRSQSETEAGSALPPTLSQFYTGVYGTIATLILMFLLHRSLPSTFGYASPQSDHWVLLLLIGLIATTGHLAFTTALKYAPASTIAPLQYTELIGATFWGWLLFDDIPTPLTLVGATIIVASGIYIFHRERVTSRQ